MSDGLFLVPASGYSAVDVDRERDYRAAVGRLMVLADAPGSAIDHAITGPLPSGDPDRIAAVAALINRVLARFPWKGARRAALFRRGRAMDKSTSLARRLAPRRAT